MRKKSKKKIAIYLLVLMLLIVLVLVFILVKKPKEEQEVIEKQNLMLDLTNKTLEENKTFIDKYDFVLEIEYDFSDTVEKDKIISQSIDIDEELSLKQSLKLTISLGKYDQEQLQKDGINELGKVPIMMYHGIVDKKSSETSYTGGNVDKDGYNRTTEAFRSDLEFYYESGYRAIRLKDYVEGNIDVTYGYSPIVITFDDGNANNLKVTGLDSEGNIIIDENCAVGILEAFKMAHPDFNTTATFFVNGALFNQKEYNDKILNWLVDNGYDVGNHTNNHDNLSKITTSKTQETIATVYKKLDEIIPDKYVKIIALPYGTPYNKKHANFEYVINGTYNDYTYNTIATLRVGWEPELSSFDKNFDKTYLKRCRAYDNNGKEFDIQMVFNNLAKNRYISDGNASIITIPEAKKDSLKDVSVKVVTY